MKRFCFYPENFPDISKYLVEDSKGLWVRFSDVEPLIAERDRLKRQLDAAMRIIESVADADCGLAVITEAQEFVKAMAEAKENHEKKA